MNKKSKNNEYDFLQKLFHCTPFLLMKNIISIAVAIGIIGFIGFIISKFITTQGHFFLNANIDNLINTEKSLVIDNGNLKSLQYEGTNLLIRKANIMEIQFHDSQKFQYAGIEYQANPSDIIQIWMPSDESSSMITSSESFSITYEIDEEPSEKHNMTMNIDQTTIAKFQGTINTDGKDIRLNLIGCKVKLPTNIKKLRNCPEVGKTEIIIPTASKLHLFFQEASLSFSTSAEVFSIVYTNIDSIIARVSGDLNFTYMSKSNKYELNNDTIDFSNSNNSITAILQKDDLHSFHLSSSGNISKAEVSGLNLFPSFWGWIYENVYLVPTTILTIIGGAISLIKSEERKQIQKKEKE